MTYGGDLLGFEALGDSLARVRAAVQPLREVAGWATVDVDRAARSYQRIDNPSRASINARDDVLGATVRLIRSTDDLEIALLEPFTEGRLAAALARHGEGVVALYMLVDAAGPAHARAAGFVLTAPGTGPFGAERLVLGGPRWGPFIILARLD